MKHEKNKNKRTITLIIVSAIILVLFFTGCSIGKEMSNIKLTANAQIAEPILIVENNPTIDITTIENTGYYDFKIKNYNSENKINEVDLKYTIEIISKHNEAIEFKIYQNEKEINLENNKTEEIDLKKGEKEETTYKLEIMYDKTKSNSKQDIIQDVQIKVHSEQAI